MDKETVQQQIMHTAHELKACESVGHLEDVKLELITILKQFLERRRVHQHIEETIVDDRNRDQIIYSKQSIILSALAIFLFRMGSGNKFDDKSHDRDEKYSKTNVSKFIDAPEDHVPVIKTIEKFLKNLEEESVNDLMIAFFKDLQKSKFFLEHPQIMPGDFFLLAADCVHTHTYDHPHHKECDGISKELNHKKNCTKKCQEIVEGWLIDQKYEWFNSCYLGEGVYTHVLRFWENRTKEGCETEYYQCEWLFSRRISAQTCELFARQARSRWEEEDIFNSLKNRGFNLKHDYSRDPRSCFNWQGLALFAFAIFELLRFSEAVMKRVDLPQITLAEKLEGQLFHRPTQEIFPKEKISKKMQLIN